MLTNERILISRNKREGAYAGRNRFGNSRLQHFRTGPLSNSRVDDSLRKRTCNWWALLRQREVKPC